MSGLLRNVESRRAPWLATTLLVTAVALAGCGPDGQDGDAKNTTSRPTKSATAAGKAEPILIKTLVDLPTGKIVDGSTLGDSPFCPGGTVKDKHGTAEIGFVDRTITCPDGTLRMGFDPQMPVGNTQSGPWRIVSGTGAYDGWEGRGQMVMRYDPTDKSPHPTKGRERYTGEVTHQEQSG